MAGPTTILNALMAEELRRFADRLEQADDFSAALHDVIRDSFAAHRRILFNGNGYDDRWIAEAERRGLANLKNTAEALPAYILPKNIQLLTSLGIYSETEMMARHEIHMEKYCKVIHIEATTLIDMVQHAILNAVSDYTASLCDTIAKKKAALPGVSCKVEEALAASLSALNEELLDRTMALKSAVETVSPTASQEDMMHYYHDTVFRQMNELRTVIDKLETLTASEYWPYPTYYDLLFSV